MRWPKILLPEQKACNSTPGMPQGQPREWLLQTLPARRGFSLSARQGAGRPQLLPPASCARVRCHPIFGWLPFAGIDEAKIVPMMEASAGGDSNRAHSSGWQRKHP